MTTFKPIVPAPFYFRPMVVADVPTVVAIEAMVMPKAWAEKGYRNELRHNRSAEYYVLEHCSGDSAQIIGYVGHILMLDEAHVSIIATSAEWQGKGLGRLLLLKTLFRAIEQNATMATLEVRESNERAQNLYKKLGFEIVGKRKKYYKDSGEAALIMTVEPLDGAYAETLQQSWQTLTARIIETFQDAS